MAYILEEEEEEEEEEEKEGTLEIYQQPCRVKNSEPVAYTAENASTLSRLYSFLMPVTISEVCRI
jgi:hypothetical protein